MHPILHPKQQEIVKSKARFKVIRAGRKSGKTTVEVEIMLFKAVAKAEKILKIAQKAKNRKVLFIAPTQKQARTIVWEALKARLGDIGIPNESRLEMKMPTEDGGYSTIFVGGWENRENYRGLIDVIHITFDETDTMKDFFMGWQEIFRPMLLDTGGSADFIGTPKKENPNLRRLEKDFAERGEDFASFHFRTADNPHIQKEEIEKARQDMDVTTYQQEIEAEYVDNAGALFKYDALIDVFSNAVEKKNEKFLIVDIADDGSDKTIFSFWEGLEEYRREKFERLNTESIIAKIREYTADQRIPYSHVAVDAIGVGAGVASSSLLDGIIGFKSSYQPIKTDLNIVRLPNVGHIESPLIPLVSDYKNLRSQCIFTLADHVNNHKIASKAVGKNKEVIIEELATYQDASLGDGKRMATPKEDVKEIIGRSPDDSDTWIMRMYFVIMGRMLPQQSEERSKIIHQQNVQFQMNKANQPINSTK